MRHSAKVRVKKPMKKMIFSLGIYVGIIFCILILAYKYVNPAPPKKIVIMTGDGEGDYLHYAKAYKKIIQDENIDLVIKESSGTMANLKALQDPSSDADVGFVIDGLASSEQDPDLVSLGSLYYEPIWIFYRGLKEISRLNDLKGLRIAIGQTGGGTEALAVRLLEASGVNSKNTHFLELGWDASAAALRAKQVDVAFFVATPEDPEVEELMNDHSIRLMSMAQADAIIKHLPYLHHLQLPQGAMNLSKNLPEKNVDLVAATTTLVAKDDFHPALIYLLLKAATEVHREPGIFEKKNEFPTEKDYELPLADAAKQFYKSGAPFWQRYFPFWFATLVDRFILVIFPLLVMIYPTAKLIPRFFQRRTKNKILQRYGELKFLETQISKEKTLEKYQEQLFQLDEIESRVNAMKVPLDFAEHVYVLREHIDFVRRSLKRSLEIDRGGAN